MKRVLNYIGIFTVSLLLGTTLLTEFSGCQKKNADKGNKLSINYDLQKTRITIRFVDAKTHQLIGNNSGKRVTVKVTGQAKEAVTDISGVYHKTYNSVHGFMTLALNPGMFLAPSPGNPVRFTLIANCKNYITSWKSILLTRESEYQIQIAMANKEDLPEGISKKWAPGLGNIVEGTLLGDVSVATPDLKIKLTIPDSTVLLDKEGNSLSSPFSVSIFYFSNKNNNVLSIFPGGLFSGIEENGNVSNGLFSSAGFTNISIVGANGKQAKTPVNRKLRLEMLVDANTYNPETQTRIANGDLISVYRFETDSGIWNREQADTILTYHESPPIADFVISTELNHLGTYNFGWFNSSLCGNPVKIIYSFDTLSVCDGDFLSGTIQKQADSTYIDWFGGSAYHDSAFRLMIAATGVPLFISWNSDSCQTTKVVPEDNPLMIDDPCSSTPLTVALTSTADNITTVVVDLSAYCPSNPDVAIRPSFGIWYRPESNLCWKWVAMHDGYSTLCGVTLGTSYIVGTYYDNRWQQWNFTVDDSYYLNLTVELSSNVCGNVFGM